MNEPHERAGPVLAVDDRVRLGVLIGHVREVLDEGLVRVELTSGHVYTVRARELVRVVHLTVARELVDDPGALGRAIAAKIAPRVEIVVVLEAPPAPGDLPRMTTRPGDFDHPRRAR